MIGELPKCPNTELSIRLCWYAYGGAAVGCPPTVAVHFVHVQSAFGRRSVSVEFVDDTEVLLLVLHLIAVRSSRSDVRFRDGQNGRSVVAFTMTHGAAVQHGRSLAAHALNVCVVHEDAGWLCSVLHMPY